MLNRPTSSAKDGPSTEPSDTLRPPASTTAMVCAAASGPLHAQPDGAGVAEHGEDDRPAAAAPVDALARGRATAQVVGLHPASRRAGLLPEDGQHPGADQAQPPAAVG